ncbi:AMP-binding protein [Sphingosinicella soli]|uniref:Malonyl-CoA/methylmalonyl-CoA synthetase n=1 Tax=Sphingosinicella soli TaxID=333708 RepID=A0A7W7B3T1_9SPHN|nr:AMP-binding protein [Sphingosinicella soli]MBB4632598.1 malonyl-CoA/methylmalonyl-CoA synthetase [Sphingosinicella soli]
MSANLAAIFYARQAGAGAKPAIVWNDAPLIDYAGLPLMAGRYRAALAALGVKRGDRVIVKTDNSPAFVYTYLAVLAAGAVFVPMNAAYTAAEVALLIEDADPVLLIHASATPVPDEAAAPVRRMTLEPDGTGSLPALALTLEPDLAVETVEEGDLAAILFTSGTTGRSKGAMLTHGNLSSNVAALNEAWRFSPEDSILHALPLFHAHGLFVALHLALYNACTLVMLQKFSAEQVIAKLGRVSVFMGVPTYYARLLADEAFDRAACASIRLFVSGSAPLLPSVFDAFEARTGHRILERYGMTEALMITSNRYEQEGRIAGTVGFPLPGVSLDIVDADRRALPPGEVGEIEIKGPNLCAGYWRRPEATAESFHPDGFFRTGDTGFKDSEGRVSIAGRSKDLIISGGFNVYPAEVEIALAEVEGVVDVAVFGVPHPDFGEAVVAAVIVDREDFDVTKLETAAGAGLARFKQPKAIHVLAELPRNAMGKIMKSELRKRYAGTFTA